METLPNAGQETSRNERDTAVLMGLPWPALQSVATKSWAIWRLKGLKTGIAVFFKGHLPSKWCLQVSTLSRK